MSTSTPTLDALHDEARGQHESRRVLSETAGVSLIMEVGTSHSIVREERRRPAPALPLALFTPPGTAHLQREGRWLIMQGGLHHGESFMLSDEPHGQPVQRFLQHLTPSSAR